MFGRRDHLIMVGVALTVVVIVVSFGLYVTNPVPRSAPRSGDASETLRVLSHNVGQDLPDYDYIDKLIRESAADLVFLQEVTGEYVDEHWPRLLDLYPYQAQGTLVDEKRIGMGVLSKYPITQHEEIKLDPESLMLQQRVVANWKGKDISLYNVHTTYPWVRLRRDPWLHRIPWPVYDDSVRQREIDALLRTLQGESNPVIAAGDFNLTERSEDHVKLTRFLRDAFSESGRGPGFTWPANRTPTVMIRPAIPFVRIDYVFHSPAFTSTAAQVLPRTGSDHKPLFIDLNFAGSDTR